MKYSEKLKDPRWQKVRLKIFERDEFECATCGNSKSTLFVHHKYYEYGIEPWDYPLNSLVTLCKTCHEEADEMRKNLRRQIALTDQDDLVMGFAAGLLMERDEGFKFEPQNCEQLLGVLLVGAQLRKEFRHAMWRAEKEFFKLKDKKLNGSAVEKLINTAHESEPII